MNKWTIGLVAMSVLSTSPAFAEKPGSKGQLAVGAERITGFVHSRTTEEDDAGKTTLSTNYFSLLTAPAGLLSGYSAPRVALDYFVADGLSIGGSFSYYRLSATVESEPAMGTSSEQSSTGSGFVLAPRVGFAHMLTDHIGIWPRAGVTYLTGSGSGDDDFEASASALALSVEVPLLLAPTENIAFSVGPTLDYGVSASSETTFDGTTTQDDPEPSHDIGVQAGLTVFF